MGELRGGVLTLKIEKLGEQKERVDHWGVNGAGKHFSLFGICKLLLGPLRIRERNGRG